MKYIPNSPSERHEMLAAIGVESVDKLFASIPENLRKGKITEIPPSQSECAINDWFQTIARKNHIDSETICLLGAGAYDHYSPAIVDDLIRRSEFSSVYTPYQPEMSQGTLQTIFEFQSLVASLMGMEICNASMYDGASATAEAALMAMRISKKQKILVSSTTHPYYRATLDTYLGHRPEALEEIPFHQESGRLDHKSLKQKLAGKPAAVLIQNPNFFGIVEDLEEISHLTHEAGALLVVVVNEPLAYGLIEAPGNFAADIVAGDLQGFGIPLQLGGPYVGFLATRFLHVRNLPGRIVGATTDTDGNRGFVLTLSTREQHIRREKSFSNICTNQALCALVTTIYMALLGKTGIQKLAEQNHERAQNLRHRLIQELHFHPKFSSPTFNEFVVTVPQSEKILQSLKDQNILFGLPLKRFYPELEGSLLLCVTEKISESKIARLLGALKGN
jgi:glycine dehydrogenase subunit 1